jgi:hypothetical protein
VLDSTRDRESSTEKRERDFQRPIEFHSSGESSRESSREREREFKRNGVQKRSTQ